MVKRKGVFEVEQRRRKKRENKVKQERDSPRGNSSHQSEKRRGLHWPGRNLELTRANPDFLYRGWRTWPAIKRREPGPSGSPACTKGQTWDAALEIHSWGKLEQQGVPGRAKGISILLQNIVSPSSSCLSNASAALKLLPPSVFVSTSPIGGLSSHPELAESNSWCFCLAQLERS